MTETGSVTGPRPSPTGPGPKAAGPGCPSILQHHCPPGAGSDVDEALEQFGSEGCKGVSSLRGNRGERRIRAGLKTKRADGAAGVLGKG
jgi:hypothetical protein